MIVRWRGETPDQGYEAFVSDEWIPVEKETVEMASKMTMVTWEPEPWMFEEMSKQ
jgi:hypothetical protein